ncbi:MAG: glycosyltransferase [Urechidicola sp.]|nr:glycosyltransferase [Urechidicola sp.]
MVNEIISIILPVYNGELFLSEAIESCLNQSCQNFELIIVNDCSTDGSLSIAKSYAAKDSRIIIIDNKENKKLPESLNIGHKKAVGEYITWTSDDNILKNNFLKVLVTSLKKNKADIVYSNYDIILADGSLKRTHDAGPTEHLVFGNKVGASFLYKKEVFDKLSGYDDSLFLLEDYDFWLRASIRFKFFHVNDNLYQYRLHESSLTHKVYKDGIAKQKHQLSTVKMFDKLGKEMFWNEITKSFCVKNLLGEKISIFGYIKNNKIIKNDLFKLESFGLDINKIESGLFLVARKQLINNKEYHNMKSLLEVLMKDKSLLFYKSFSKKATLKYIKKCLL